MIDLNTGPETAILCIEVGGPRQVAPRGIGTGVLDRLCQRRQNMIKARQTVDVASRTLYACGPSVD